MSRTAAALAVALAVVGACGFDPEPSSLHFSLSKNTLEATRDAALIRERVQTLLDRAFAPPSDAHYRLEAGWEAAGVDPNWPARARGANSGTGEITPEDRDALRASNRTAFRRALAEIERGRIVSGADELPRSASVLAETLRATEVRAAGRDAREEARALVDEWYPSLLESAELYRTECLQCHGVEGGGDGPSSFGLVPKPRDYRLGIFKYTSVSGQGRPRRADLLRTLDQGIPGTSMPNFQRLSLAQRHGLVDYVRYLAIRGEVEASLVATWKEDDELPDDVIAEAVGDVWSRWERSIDKVVSVSGDVPPSTPERIARGDALFHDATKGNCAACHGADGRGDGPASWKIDASGKRSPAYVDAWGEPIVPRNLRDGVFRGGSRPIDVYRRIYSGIPGGPMPALGGVTDKDGRPVVTEDDLWCLVHYVRSLGRPGEAP